MFQTRLISDARVLFYNPPACFSFTALDALATLVLNSKMSSSAETQTSQQHLGSALMNEAVSTCKCLDLLRRPVWILIFVFSLLVHQTHTQRQGGS